MDSSDDRFTKTKSSGQVVFVLAAILIVAILLSQITGQTVWTDRARNFASQPRFWPAVALLVMLAGFVGHFALMWRRRPNALDWIETRRWTEPLEYLFWFMAYVLAVPVAGFLPMSLLLALALTWRLGYRSRLHLGCAGAFAVATVLLFKSFLGVNIPGGRIYEILPGALRSFALTNL